MLWSFAYLVACRLFALVVLCFRSSGSKELEIVVLRHELSILRRQAKRPQLRESDRLPARGVESGGASAVLVGVLGEFADAAALAPAAGRAPLDVSARSHRIGRPLRAAKSSSSSSASRGRTRAGVHADCR